MGLEQSEIFPLGSCNNRMVTENIVPTRIDRLPKLSELGTDLARISPRQRIRTLSLPFLCFLIYVGFALLEYWSAAVLVVMLISFITYGSISHDLVHRNLGLPNRWNDIFLSMIELLALRSGHAYQAAHLYHHSRFPHEDDIEGAAARMTLQRTLLEGVIFQMRISLWALKHEKRKRTWIVLELLGCAVFFAVAVLLSPISLVLLVYVILMIMGSWVIPLITSYIPHDAHAQDALHQTRVFRGVVASTIAMEHLYHWEHHLYPSVPHHHWPILAKRLNPYLAAAGIKPIKIGF